MSHVLSPHESGAVEEAAEGVEGAVEGVGVGVGVEHIDGGGHEGEVPVQCVGVLLLHVALLDVLHV